MKFTYEKDEERNIYPNLTVEKRFADNVLSGWRVSAKGGYVFYFPDEINIEMDVETGEQIKVIYYNYDIDYPALFNWDNFNAVVIPESEMNKEQATEEDYQNALRELGVKI